MSRHLRMVILLLVVAVCNAQKPETYECIQTSKPQTRTFSTLLQYQANKLSFKYGAKGYAGNYVDFSFQSINKLPKNSFNSFDSNYIIKMTLANKQIEIIDDGAFLYLHCLHFLILRNNSIKALGPGTFEGLDNLQELDLSFNFLDEVRDAVFKNMKSLKVLNLANNRIEQLSVMAFDGLSNLNVLLLSNNMLRLLHPEIFIPLGQLMELYLDSNRLRDMQPETWKNLTKLTTLNLANNTMVRFDPTYNFSFSSLKILNLSSNSLTQLNVYSLRKRLPMLTTMDLNDNPWLCEDLAVIVRNLKDSAISFAGKNNSFDNEEGIACLKSADFTSSTAAPTTTSTTTTQKSSANVPVPRGVSADDFERTKTEILDAISRTHNLIAAMLVIILMFIALEFVLRTGLFSRRSRRELYMLDNNTPADNIALLRD